VSLRQKVKMKFTIQGRLTTLNEYILAERRNRFLGAKLKKQATENVAWQVKRLKKINGPATYTFLWYVKNSKTDSDNIAFACKFIFDGLQEAGILANDSFKNVLAIDHRFQIDKNERVEVIVDEYE